jgi:serine/threonine-protein kinase RsbW
MPTDCITLTVPAKGEYAKTVRMTASALVSRMDMSYDDVDDVRIAAEEAFVYACDSALDTDEVTFEFRVEGNTMEMKVSLGGERAADEDAERRAAYATFILQSVCDQFELSSDETGSYLRVLKRAGSGGEDVSD